MTPSAYSGPDAAERKKAEDAARGLAAVLAMLSTIWTITKGLLFTPWRALCAWWVLNLWLPTIHPPLSVTYWQTLGVLAVLSIAFSFTAGSTFVRIGEKLGGETGLGDVSFFMHFTLPLVYAVMSALVYLVIYLPFAPKVIAP